MPHLHKTEIGSSLLLWRNLFQRFLANSQAFSQERCQFDSRWEIQRIFVYSKELLNLGDKIRDHFVLGKSARSYLFLMR